MIKIAGQFRENLTAYSGGSYVSKVGGSGMSAVENAGIA